jgi:insulysin
MVDFYSHFISTSSPQRSKLSVHLQAQAKAKEPSLDEKKTAAAAALKIILAEHKITANEEAFQTRIKSASSNEAISDAVASHLTDDLKVEKEVANKVLDEAKAALGVADSGLPAVPQALDASADVKKVVDASHPVLIEDVHAWKASMQVSSGVRPVRNLEEFVEVAEKL